MHGFVDTCIHSKGGDLSKLIDLSKQQALVGKLEALTTEYVGMKNTQNI
jgi:hypothetical protein